MKKIAFCFLVYDTINNEDLWELFFKNVDKNRVDYSVYLNSYIEKLDKISSASDFKKRIDNNDYFKNIYKQKQYWELIK